MTKRCPITYEKCGDQRYSIKGLRLVSRKLRDDLLIPWDAQEQLQAAVKLADRLSIGGVQPKICVRLNVAEQCFEMLERGGTYIIKPPHPGFPEIPENEDVTMHLAKTLGIEVPLHGLAYAKDGTLSYFIRRFDRYGHGKKLAVEDFTQLSGHSRGTKYDSSMERVVAVIEKHCSFPMVEKLKLFRLVLFCFLVGNEDMHLKNFSLIRRDGLTSLSPAYDLLNSEILLDGNEEMALPLNGKKRKLTRADLLDYYGQGRLGLTPAVISDELERLQSVRDIWTELLEKCFLSESMKVKYLAVLDERRQRLGLE